MTDVIGMGPERFREAIALLPVEKVVGYVSDLSVSSQDGRRWNSCEDSPFNPPLPNP